MSYEPSPDDRPARFFYRVTAYPRTVLIVCIVILLAPIVFLPRLTRDTSAEAFISKDDPALTNRESVTEIFGLGDPLVVAVINDGNNGVFTPDTLSLVWWFSEQLAEVPGIDPEQITSLATRNNIVGTDDAMLVEPFMESASVSQSQALAIREAVMDFELYVGNLVAEDGSATLIVAELLDDADEERVYRAVLALRERAPIADETVYVTGEAAVSSVLSQYINQDVRRLNPFTALVVTLMLILAFRTLRGVLLPSLVMVGAGIWAIGTMAASGTPFYIITNGLIPILIAISVADGIHILHQYYEEMAARPEATSRELAVRAMVEMWRPVLVTSLTDVAGMLAIFFASTMPPMRAFGLFASVGVMIALVLSLFCIPALLTILKPKPSAAFRPAGGTEPGYQADRFGRALGRLGSAVLARPRAILALAAGLLVLGIFGATRLEVNEDRVSNLVAGHELRRADRALNTAFAGTSFLDIVVEADEPDGLLEPEVLHRIEAMQTHLAGIPHVGKTVSVVDYLKQMNRAMNSDQPDYYRVPESAALAAQYFLLYSISGGPTDFEEVIDYDYQAGIVRVAIDTGLYSERKRVVEEADRYVADNFASGDGLAALVSGRVDVDYHWISGIARSHFQSVFLALLAVWLVASLSYRSPVGGALAVLPVCVAVLLIYAVMGFSGIWLGVGTSMFAAIAIGTGIDFAVHTLDRIIALVRKEGHSLEEAMARFYPSTGRALFFNFGVLALGFLVLVASSAPPLVRFGTLVGVAAVASFLASVTVLPALILTLRPTFLTAERPQRRKARGMSH